MVAVAAMAVAAVVVVVRRNKRTKLEIRQRATWTTVETCLNRTVSWSSVPFYSAQKCFLSYFQFSLYILTHRSLRHRKYFELKISAIQIKNGFILRSQLSLVYKKA